MDFYLIDKDAGDELHLPVNPSEFSLQSERLYETFKLINYGEIDFITGGKKVKEIKFSSFFPARYDPAYCRYLEIPAPKAALKLLEKWTTNQNPIRVLITETEINDLFLICSNTCSVKGGEPDDIYFELQCRRYVELQVESNDSASNPVSTTSQRVETKRPPTVYQVKGGDSLWVIAKRELGSGNRWKEIYELNKQVIGADPNLIKPGQRLVMPG